MIKELKIKPGTSLKELDFIKGIAIYFVILLHCIPVNILLNNGSLITLSIGQPVPLFMFIGGFLFYYASVIQPPDFKNSFSKLFKRIIIPFLAVIAAIYIGMLLVGDFRLKYLVFIQNLGPGSYFPVAYCQIILLLILFHKLTASIRNSLVLIVGSLLACILLEFLNLYVYKTKYGPEICRLLCIQYIFIAILGYIVCKILIAGFKPNYINGVSLLLCFLASAYYSVSPQNIFTFGGLIPAGMGGPHHTLSAFYTLAFFLLLVWIMKYIPFPFTQITIMAGKASYHIFLFQMLYFKIVGRSDYFDFIENIWLKSLATATCVMITLIINALGGYLVYLGIKRTKEQFITLKQNKPIHKFFEGS